MYPIAQEEQKKKTEICSEIYILLCCAHISFGTFHTNAGTRAFPFFFVCASLYSLLC